MSTGVTRGVAWKVGEFVSAPKGLPLNVGAQCAACRKPATVTAVMPNDFSGGVTVAVECHGSRELVKVSEASLKLGGVIVVAFSEDAKEKARRFFIRQHAEQSRARRSAARNRWRFGA